MIPAGVRMDPGEDADRGAIVLKSNVKRTVLVERPVGREATLVKRFHGPGLSRLRDRRRARTEAGALATAAGRGLPVPAVRGVALEGRSWTLRLEWIEDARPLDEVLQRAPARARRTNLARRLGQVLAQAERAGLRHPDPHAGNVLVDGAGQVWLVDLARVRFGAASTARFRQMLVRACARTRQITTPGFRALVYRHYLAARTLATRPPEASEIEAEARTLQRHDMARRVAVWCRTSSATVVAEGADGQRVVRVREAGDAPEAGWTIRRIDGDRRSVHRVWTTVVRATLHGIPSARPRALALAPPWFVEVDVPDPGTASASADVASAASLRALLADRGLALEGPELVDANGCAYVGPDARLIPIGPIEVTDGND